VRRQDDGQAVLLANAAREAFQDIRRGAQDGSPAAAFG
jgi:hypothetical protein